MTKFMFVTKNIKPLIPLVTKSQFVAKDLPIYMPVPYFISILSSQNIRTQPTPVRRNPTDANKHEPIRCRFTISSPIHHSVADSPFCRRRFHHSIVSDFPILSPVTPFHHRSKPPFLTLHLPSSHKPIPTLRLPSLTNPSRPFASLSVAVLARGLSDSQIIL